MALSRNAIIGIATVLLVVAGTWWYLQDDSVDVDFAFQISSSNGCSGQIPGYGFVTSHAELVLRDNNNKLMATVPLHKSAGGGSSYCHMIGIATVPKADVYKATFESNGSSVPVGFIDWDDLKDGSVTMVNP